MDNEKQRKENKNSGRSGDLQKDTDQFLKTMTADDSGRVIITEIVCALYPHDIQPMLN